MDLFSDEKVLGAPEAAELEPIEHPESDPGPVPDPRDHEYAPLYQVPDELKPLVYEMRMRLGALESRVQELMLAIDEGINRVSRSERRVKAVVQSARRQLAELGLEHDGLEAEAAELRLVDGGGGEGEGVPPVPAGMDDGAAYDDTPSGIPGLTEGDLNQLRQA